MEKFLKDFRSHRMFPRIGTVGRPGGRLFVFLKRLKCETPENLDFLRKDKMVISVKIRNFSRSRMTKRTSPLESSREI